MSEQERAQFGQSATGAANADTGRETTARVFVYNGQEYPDPDPALAVEHVRRELARFVPELTNADVRKERRTDGTTQFVFTKRLGTKGAIARGGVDGRTSGLSTGRDGAEGTSSAPNARLIALIGAIDETRLQIFRLVHELVRPDGEFDLDAVAARGEEVERASAEAHEHAPATAGVRDSLLKLAARG